MIFSSFESPSRWFAIVVTIALLPIQAAAGSKGMDPWALAELRATGVNKYLGQFKPSSTEDVGDGWTRHNFDSQGGDGPICIDGSDYAVFTRKGRDKKKLLIMLQGGGACWQGLTQCTQSLTSGTLPPAPRQGIWDFDSKDNPFARYSIVYMPYCDGSVFSGDNVVDDPTFTADNGSSGIRYHRGLRNLSAGMDVARDVFKKPKMITVAGSSAGGVGASGFAPFLVRFLYGNKVKRLTVFNDAGPNAINLDTPAAIAARDADWQFGQFYPPSCTDCSAFGQQTAIVKWRLQNDKSIREAYYETDADATNRFFMGVNLPGVPFFVLLNQNMYRDIIIDEHGAVNELYPKRYKRFVVSGDYSHTALQLPLFYTQTVDGVPLNEWTRAFLGNKKAWQDLVEPFKAAPEPDPLAF